MTVILNPDKNRSPFWLMAFLVPIPVAMYLYQGYHVGNWGAAREALYLVVPAIVLPLFLRYGLISGKIEFSDDELKLTSPLRGRQIYAWKDLKYYGPGNGDFMIQFGNEPALQINSGAYAEEDWSKLMDFLTSRFPDRKADGFAGAHLFQWDRRKD